MTLLVDVLFLFFLLVVFPWLGLRTHRSGVIAAAPRTALYASVVLTHWLLLLPLAFVLWFEGRGLASLGVHRVLPWPLVLLWSASIVAIAVACMLGFAWAGQRLGRRESASVRHILPRTTRERWWFVLLVSPTAGIVEELLFRGFALTRLAPLVGGLAAAIALTSFAFALAHVYQGALGMARAGLLAVLLAVPVVVSGSLLPSILAHAAIDALGATVLARVLAGVSEEKMKIGDEDEYRR